MTKILSLHKLKIVQWNYRFLTPKWPELGHLFETKTIQLSVIHETWLTSNGNMTIKHYNVFYANRYD